MNYGNSNDVIQNCPQCDSSIDTHKISIIRSTDKTDALARKLQSSLTRLHLDSILRGIELERSSTMVGAAIVNYTSSSQQYITVSGPGVFLLRHINLNDFGKKVIIIDNENALVRSKTQNCRKEKLFTPDTSQGLEYPVGSCAAQKLLARIFQDARSFDSIRSIEMSEIMWRASGGRVGHASRKWTAGDVVPSCKTCKQVIPQMLCNRF